MRFFLYNLQGNKKGSGTIKMKASTKWYKRGKNEPPTNGPRFKEERLHFASPLRGIFVIVLHKRRGRGTISNKDGYNNYLKEWETLYNGRGGADEINFEVGLTA